MSTLPTLFNTVLEVTVNSVRQEKAIKGKQIGKKEIPCNTAIPFLGVYLKKKKGKQISVEYLGFCTYKIISSANKDIFTFSFPIWVPLFLF